MPFARIDRSQETGGSKTRRLRFLDWSCGLVQRRPAHPPILGYTQPYHPMDKNLDTDIRLAAYTTSVSAVGVSVALFFHVAIYPTQYDAFIIAFLFTLIMLSFVVIFLAVGFPSYLHGLLRRTGWRWLTRLFALEGFFAIALEEFITDAREICNWAMIFITQWVSHVLSYALSRVRQNLIVDLVRKHKTLQNRGSRTVLPSTLHGIASYEMKVLDFVEGGDGDTVGASSSSSWLLGICGMRGVGKTTLLRFLRDSYAHDNFPFDKVFFIGAGTGCSVDRLQRVLSIYLRALPPPHMSDDASLSLAKRISICLEGTSFLLLLDDVRETLDLAAIGLPMPLGDRQKVIFTARNPAICAKMGCGTGNTIIQMKCLGQHDAWNLFKDKVGAEIIDAHPHIKHLADKMVKECGGLPSALCTLGRAMSTKRDIKEWRYAYDVLFKCKLPPHQDDEIQEMDNDGNSHLHQLEDTLHDSCLF